MIEVLAAGLRSLRSPGALAPCTPAEGRLLLDRPTGGARPSDSLRSRVNSWELTRASRRRVWVLEAVYVCNAWARLTVPRTPRARVDRGVRRACRIAWRSFEDSPDGSRGAELVRFALGRAYEGQRPSANEVGRSWGPWLETLRVSKRRAEERIMVWDRRVAVKERRMAGAAGDRGRPCTSCGLRCGCRRAALARTCGR